MSTKLNNALIRGLFPYFIKRTDIAQNAAMLNSLFLNLSYTRGYWNMASYDATPSLLYDMSGQGRSLGNTNGTFLVDLVTPYYSIDAGRLLRGDEVGLRITDDLTIISICKFTNATGGVECVGGAKWGAAGNKSYRLARSAVGKGIFSVSSDGTAVTSITGTYTIPDNKWVLLVGRYIPSTSLTLWSIPFEVNGVSIDSYKEVNTTSIPAAIFNSTAPFTIGSNGIGGEQFKGNVMYSGLYNIAHPDRIIFSIYELAKPVVGA